MKKTIQSIIGSAIIIVGAIKLFGMFSDSKEAPKKNNQKILTAVETVKVKNTTLPIQIHSTGSILAKERTELYAEVQGVFDYSSQLYKPGVAYKKGQTLIHIDDSEYETSVQAQRINFKSLIIESLADIQFDYASELTTWKGYANSIVSDKTLPAIPETKNESFSNYLSGKLIYGNYYTIKNLEERLSKYAVYAPFSGVLVTADIDLGTLVSPGQKLGEFIKTGTYELELNVNASLASFLKLGKTVTLYSIDHSKNLTGVVSRINAQIDRTTQTKQVFVEVVSEELSEGEYLEANIEAQEIANVLEIDRSLIIDQNYVFTLSDSVLVKQQIAIVHSNKNTVIVSGLLNDTELVSSPVPNGYEGMKVAVQN